MHIGTVAIDLSYAGVIAFRLWPWWWAGCLSCDIGGYVYALAADDGRRECSIGTPALSESRMHVVASSALSDDRSVLFTLNAETGVEQRSCTDGFGE